MDEITFRYPIGSRQSVYDSEELTALELAGRTAAKVNEVVKATNDFDAKVKVKEDSQALTINRKLSPNGNFTGLINGKPSVVVVAKGDSNQDKINYLANQFADGQTGLIIDGGFFEETNIKKNLDGGVF